MTDEETLQPELNIELDEEIAQGTYANLAIIAHSTSEFVIDFVRIMPGLKKVPVKSRIILTPEHAKRLLLSLGENVAKYEGAFGIIQIPTSEMSDTNFPIAFGGGEA